MIRFIFIFFILTIGNALQEDMYLESNQRIVGGKDASIEDFPYQVSVQRMGINYCGGGILSEVWIITTKICDIRLGDLIRAGSSYHDKEGSLHTVIQIIGHEDYKMTEQGAPINNIQLIKVKEPFKFDKTRQPMVLFDAGEKVKAGSLGKLAGWGDLDLSDYFTDRLQSITLPVIAKEKCDEIYNYSFGGTPKNVFCAGYLKGGKDACVGDDGGALTVDGRVAGIMSWEIGCAEPGYPGVYIEISAYRLWIDEKLNNSYY